MMRVEHSGVFLCIYFLLTEKPSFHHQVLCHHTSWTNRSGTPRYCTFCFINATIFTLHYSKTELNFFYSFSLSCMLLSSSRLLCRAFLLLSLLHKQAPCMHRDCCALGSWWLSCANPYLCFSPGWVSALL